MRRGSLKGLCCDGSGTDPFRVAGPLTLTVPHPLDPFVALSSNFLFPSVVTAQLLLTVPLSLYAVMLSAADVAQGLEGLPIVLTHQTPLHFTVCAFPQSGAIIAYL